jgi:hypothetical protein
MSEPDIVRIDDLADPVFPPDVAEMMEAAAPFADALVLEVDAICEQASAEVGLADFGGDGFRDPMGAALHGFGNDVTLSPMGHISVHTLFTQLVRNRLLIADQLNRHPEIRDIPVNAPIIVAGLPRTGTTHLHNLLSADPALRSLPYWESLEPVPLPTDVNPPGGEDPRIERTRVAVDFTNAALPYFRRMHEMTVDHRHEEIQLLAIDFSTMYIETMAPMPSWRDRYLEHDQTPHYEYLRTVLQVLTFLRGGERWVLKSPQHLEQFAALLAVFPDATVVVTHRDPVAVTASMATMLAYTSRLQLARVDPVLIGRYWMERLHTMLATAMAERELLPAGQSMDVRFNEFMADDLGTVARIYELAGQPLDEAARAAHARYLAGHRRDRFGRVTYDLADFDIDPADCRSGFARYISRFGLEA